MKTLLLVLLTLTILFASDEAVTNTTKKQQETNKYANISAKIEKRIAQREQERAIKNKLREEKIQKLDLSLKEKAKKREEAV